MLMSRNIKSSLIDMLRESLLFMQHMSIRADIKQLFQM